MWVGGQRIAPASLTLPADLVPIVQGAGWAPGTVWTHAENLAPTRTRTLDGSTSSDSLYRLSYCGPPGGVCSRHKSGVKFEFGNPNEKKLFWEIWAKIGE